MRLRQLVLSGTERQRNFFLPLVVAVLFTFVAGGYSTPALPQGANNTETSSQLVSAPPSKQSAGRRLLRTLHRQATQAGHFMRRLNDWFYFLHTFENEALLPEDEEWQDSSCLSSGRRHESECTVITIEPSPESLVPASLSTLPSGSEVWQNPSYLSLARRPEPECTVITIESYHDPLIPVPLPMIHVMPRVNRQYLESLQPDVWRQLGLHQLPYLHYEINRVTESYRNAIDSVRQGLASQQPGLPCMDIFLLDARGTEFSLSCLPTEWLQVPEIVEQLLSLGFRNTPGYLNRRLSLLQEIREIAQLIKGEGRRLHLRDELEKRLKGSAGAPPQALKLTAFRSESGLDFIQLILSMHDGFDGFDGAISKVYQYGGILPKREHLLTSMQKNTCHYYETMIIIRWLEGENVKLPRDYLHLAMELDIHPVARRPIIDNVPVTEDDVLMYLRRPPKPLNIIKGIRTDAEIRENPEAYQEFLRNRRDHDSIIHFINRLRDREIDPAAIQTEHGSLVDYALALHPRTHSTLYTLYFMAGIQATRQQLVKTIEYASHYTDEDSEIDEAPLAVIWKLQEQGDDLSLWRNSEVETLAEYGLRLGVNGRTLSILYHLKNSNIPPPKRFFDEAEQRKATRSASQVSVTLAQTDFHVSNQAAYLGEVTSLLSASNYGSFSVASDGFCFYHALEAMYHIPAQQLQAAIQSFIEAISDNIPFPSQLTAAQQQVLNLVGDLGVQEALLEMVAGGWGTHHLMFVIPAILQQLNNSNTEVVAILPSEQGHATFVQFTVNGAEVIGQVPDHAPVLIFNGVDHWYYGLYQGGDELTSPGTNTTTPPEQSASGNPFAWLRLNIQDLLGSSISIANQ